MESERIVTEDRFAVHHRRQPYGHGTHIVRRSLAACKRLECFSPLHTCTYLNITDTLTGKYIKRGHKRPRVHIIRNTRTVIDAGLRNHRSHIILK